MLNNNTIAKPIDPIAFRIGDWAVHWYGLIIGFGIICAYIMFTKEAKRKGYDEEKVSDLFFWTIIFGFVGARIYYVVFNLDYYLKKPDQILAVWNGGLAIYGGVIAGAITIYYLCRRYKLSFIGILDCIVPGLMLAQAIGRFGNFINQEAYGGIVSRDFLENLHLPKFIIDQMYIQGEYRQPTFLYEASWNFLGCLIICILRRRPNLLKEGEPTIFYVVWYGIGRFFVEGMRTDSLYLGKIRISKLVALLSVVIGVVVFIYRRKNMSLKPYLEGDYKEENR